MLDESLERRAILSNNKLVFHYAEVVKRDLGDFLNSADKEIANRLPAP